MKMSVVKSINPYTGAVVNSYKTHTQQEVIDSITKANTRFNTWQNTSFDERKNIIVAVAKTLKENAATYAETITREMGKPITQAIAEVEKCAWVCEYYAENAALQLADKTIKTDAYKSYISYEPLGVLLAVMPWNYPFWQVFRFAIPALMAGNVVVLKHASNVFGSALLIERVFQQAGLPKDCFSTLLIESEAVKTVIAHPYIKAVTLTGSGGAGAAVASIAGKEIKKTVLELGGSNALVVFSDADIDKTVDICVTARFQNTGQSCIAGKRLLVSTDIADEFIEKLQLKVSELKSGNPLDKDTYIGVMAREDLAEELETQLQKSVAMGAKILLGGKRNKAYFEPTLVTEVSEHMPIFKEETFGPVLSITTFESEDEAIRLSNTSEFGLGVSLFSNDINRMQSYTPLLNEGAVFINQLVKSDPRLPFGGIKKSGYGRELSSEGIREFVNIKTVLINQ